MRDRVGRPVVVTGLGVVAGSFSNVDQLRDALRTSTPAFSEIDRSAGYHVDGSSRLAGRCRTADLGEWLKPAEARRMSPPSKLAVAAARMAVKDAGIDVAGP